MVITMNDCLYRGGPQLEKTPNVVITTIYRLWSFVVTMDVPIVTGAALVNVNLFR